MGTKTVIWYSRKLQELLDELFSCATCRSLYIIIRQCLFQKRRVLRCFIHCEVIKQPFHKEHVNWMANSPTKNAIVKNNLFLGRSNVGEITRLCETMSNLPSHRSYILFKSSFTKACVIFKRKIYWSKSLLRWRAVEYRLVRTEHRQTCFSLFPLTDTRNSAQSGPLRTLQKGDLFAVATTIKLSPTFSAWRRVAR
jgi:hypothetical protein